MKRWLFALILCGFFGLATAQVSQYTVIAPPYTEVFDFTPPCPDGQMCANFTPAMGHSGSFTVASPLAPNLAFQDISSLLTAYSFSDGINTYSSTDVNSRIYLFAVETDAQGQVTDAQIFLERWLTGTNGAHVPGDRFSIMALGLIGYHNAICAEVAASPSNGTELCAELTNEDEALSAAGYSGPSLAWSRASLSDQIVSVPTLSQWALLAMVFFMMLLVIAKNNGLRKQVNG